MVKAKIKLMKLKIKLKLAVDTCLLCDERQLEAYKQVEKICARNCHVFAFWP